MKIEKRYRCKFLWQYVTELDEEFEKKIETFIHKLFNEREERKKGGIILEYVENEPLPQTPICTPVIREDGRKEVMIQWLETTTTYEE